MRFTPLCVLVLVACGGGAPRFAGAPLADGLEVTGPLRARAPRHLVDGYPAFARDGVAHAVIEIPAGTNAKVEVDHDAGDLAWEVRQGRPRVVDFLGYPGSYGFVPSTVLRPEDGGDGDPLDVLVLGASIERGAVVQVRPVAVLRLLDEGERDDKILCVLSDVEEGAPFAGVRDLADLERDYPAALEIIATWFASYDGDPLEVQGWADAATARAMIQSAADAYATHTDAIHTDEAR